MVGRRESSFNPPESHPEPTEEEGLKSRMLSLTVELQSAGETTEVSVRVSQMHGQCIPSISPGIQHVLFLLSCSPLFPQSQTEPSQASCFPTWPLAREAKSTRISTSLELKALSSSLGGVPQTGRGISARRKRRSSSPGQNRCFLFQSAKFTYSRLP